MIGDIYCNSMCVFQPGIIESLLMATQQRPWLWGVYVFTVGLPAILFVSFMWPDKVESACLCLCVDLSVLLCRVWSAAQTGSNRESVFLCRDLVPLIKSITTRSLTMLKQMILSSQSGQRKWIPKVMVYFYYYKYVEDVLHQ